MTFIISILPSIHVSSFMKKYEELFKLSLDPEKCDRQTHREADRHTDRQTDRRTERKPQSASHNSPPVKPVGDNKKKMRWIQWNIDFNSLVIIENKYFV